MPRDSVRLAAVNRAFVVVCAVSFHACCLSIAGAARYLIKRLTANAGRQFCCVPSRILGRLLLLHFEVVVAAVRHNFLSGFGKKLSKHDRCTVVLARLL